MWLLSTDRAELKYFSSPEAVKECYAILSHRWVGQEQNYQDVQRIIQACARSDFSRNPRDHMDDKIRRACEVAKSHGHKWIWIDTCCIDKSSSAELSEAINSMYRYYALSEICYVYLHDVAEGSRGPAIFACEWITRGWTLQELLAPKVVVFLDRAWQPLGTKGDFAEELQRCTDIPMSLLRFEEELYDFSVTERMSWASRRQTERIEDQAYSLLGIFDVNMPTLYGEGAKAFQRLQEEIMQRSPDTTLFAWGEVIEMVELESLCNVSNTKHGLLERAIESIYRYMTPRMGLFASTPRDFASYGRIKYHPIKGNDVKKNAREWSVPAASGGSGTSLQVPTFRVTPYGVLSEIPVIECKNMIFGDLYWFVEHRDSEGRFLPRERLLLILNVEQYSDPTRPLYYTGALPASRRAKRPRLVCIPQDQYNNLLRVDSQAGSLGSQWKTLYLGIVYRQPATHESTCMLSNNSLYTRFRVSESAIADLLDKVPELSLVHMRNSDAFLPWTKEPTRTAEIMFSMENSCFTIYLGQCTRNPSSRASDRHRSWTGSRSSEGSSSTRRPEPWATVDTSSRPDSNEPSHSCRQDHILDWRDMKSTFQLRYSTKQTETDDFTPVRVTFLTLSFSPCPMNPDTTLALQFKVRTHQHEGPTTSSPSSGTAYYHLSRGRREHFSEPRRSLAYYALPFNVELLHGMALSASGDYSDEEWSGSE